jgi:branched-chain amino acid transport system substrate-binding protein
MKTRITTAVALALSTMALSAATFNTGVFRIGVAHAEADIPIGAVEILSGPASAYGIAIRQGFELALSEINKVGVLNGRHLVLTVEDSAGNKDQAINAARLLVGRDKVVAVLGPTLSTEIFAVGPVVNARHIPEIGTSTTATGVTDIGPYIFSTALREADVIPVAIAAAAAKGAKSIAILYANDDAFSKSGFDVMKAAAEQHGMKVLATEGFATKDTDFSAQLTKIKALKPDAVGISALVEPVSGVLLQARQLGFGPETIFIGGNGSNSPKLGEIAGHAADGLIVGTPWAAAKPDPKNRAFVAAFREKYGKDPDQFAAQAYETIFLLAQAVDHSGDATPDHIRDALTKVDHDGILGPFTFNANRGPASTAGVVVLVVKDGKFTVQ